MAWAKIDVADLSSSAGSVTTTAEPPKIFNLFLATLEKSAVAANAVIRLGNSTVDSGTNYSSRRSLNGGAETTGINSTSIIFTGTAASPEFYFGYFINISSEEKLLIGFWMNQNLDGASRIPTRLEVVGKWDDTSNQTDKFQINGGGDTFISGGNLSQLGTD